MVQELLGYAEKGKRHPAEKVLKRAYAQESTVIKARRQGERSRLQAQSLGLLWLCGRDVLRRFATSRPLLENGLSPCFAILDSEAGPSDLTSAVLQPTEEALHWECTIRELFELRSIEGDEVWRVCDAGAKELACFDNFVLGQMTGCIPPDFRVVPPWTERAWRITLLLHLLNETRGAVVGADTARHAVRLTAWYLGRQMRLLPKL